MGSLGSDTNISNIHYRNIYTWKSNQMYMVKSNGGSGTVSNVLLENFIGHGNAYSLDIDSAWSSMDEGDGDGVQLNNLTVRHWRGTEEDGSQRGPIKVICPDTAPCTDIKIRDFAMWTESGDEQTYTCQSAYGEGYCLQDGDETTSYSTTATATAAPSGYAAPRMSEDLSTAFGTDQPIPIPTIPASFFPGVKPYSTLAGGMSSSAIPSSTPGANSSHILMHRHHRRINR